MSREEELAPTPIMVKIPEMLLDFAARNGIRVEAEWNEKYEHYQLRWVMEEEG